MCLAAQQAASAAVPGCRHSSAGVTCAILQQCLLRGRKVVHKSTPNLMVQACLAISDTTHDCFLTLFGFAWLLIQAMPPLNIMQSLVHAGALDLALYDRKAAAGVRPLPVVKLVDNFDAQVG